MHLLTIASSDDLNIIREACKKRYTTWTFTIRPEHNASYIETALGVNEQFHSLHAEWIPQERLSPKSRRKTHLTNPEVNMWYNLLPAFAQAFYEGLCKGREAKV